MKFLAQSTSRVISVAIHILSADNKRQKICSKLMKGSKERLFIRTQTHSLQIFGVIPFVKLQKKHTLKQQLNG